MSTQTKSMKKHATHAITGFELQKIALHNLQHWGLKPTTKIVLWVLIDCYNPENGSVVFPSMEYIAKIGDMGLTSAKEGIKELINKGLIIKSKRDKVSGNYNKYLLTPKVQNLTSEQSENEFLEQSKSDLFMIVTNKKEKINNKKNVVVLKNSPKEDAEGVSSTAIPSDIPECLKRKVATGEIRNLQNYWNSLRPKVKDGYKKQDILEKQKIQDREAAEKYAIKQCEIPGQIMEQNKRDAKTSAPATPIWYELKAEFLKNYKKNPCHC